MTPFIARAYAGTSDLEAIAHLRNQCSVADQDDNVHSVKSIARAFEAPGFDPEQQIRLWQDDTGQLVAVAALWLPPKLSEPIEGFLNFSIHPNWGDRSLASDIIAWGEDCLRSLANLLDHSAELHTGCRDYKRDRIATLEAQGFQRIRTFLTLERSLLDDIPTPVLPEGYQVIDGAAIQIPVWVELYNQTFIDHWHHEPVTEAICQYWLSDPDYRPELDLVAIAPDGTYAAFCECHIDQNANTHFRRQWGWVSTVGTRRGFRRMGLGRAMLLTGLHRLTAAGMTTAQLMVDTQNPNQAMDLYESVGFQPKYRFWSYAKSLT